MRGYICRHWGLLWIREKPWLQHVSYNSSSGQNPPTNELSFNATSTAPGTIVVPQSKVDVFILYTADNDSDDSGSGYEGACVTLNSLSVFRQSKTVNGTETVTQSFSAH